MQAITFPDEYRWHDLQIVTAFGFRRPQREIGCYGGPSKPERHPVSFPIGFSPRRETSIRGPPRKCVAVA